VISSKLGWSKQGFMFWAWNEGCAFRQARDAAAHAGTLGHLMIESDIKDRALPGFEVPAGDCRHSSRSAFLNYLQWKRQMHFTPITMEVPLVSEVLQVGTTVDVVGRVAEQRNNANFKRYLSMEGF
jgi:hypothetical protein